MRAKMLWQQLRRFLFGTGSRELLVFLFFLFVSAGFWLLQALDESYDTEIEVPVEMTDVPDDVVITTPLPDFLRVSIRDKGTVLTRYWRHDIVPLQISFLDYDKGTVSGMVRVPQTDVLKAVQERIYGTSRIQAIHPDTLVYYFNHGMHASRPVKVTGVVETDPHYYLMSLETDPSEVEVYASPNILDTLVAVPTQPFDLTNIKENSTWTVKLQSVQGAKFIPDSVRVRATVDVYMENVIEIPVVPLNFPGDKVLRTFPSTVKVTYTSGYARSREINRRNFISVVTYEEILDLQRQGKTKIPVRIKSIPEDVSNVRIEPGELDYLIETVNDAQ